MAGDWIKMRTNLSEDPAVVRLASGLNLDRYSVVGRLHKIWAWANEHSVDGQNVPIDADFLDSLVATPGFTAQLRSVGWLSGRDGSLCFPSFERHNGDSAKSRALDAQRKKKSRKASGKPSEKCPGDDRTESGPEKRREEKSIPPNPQGVKGWEELRIPEPHNSSERFLEHLGRYAQLQASKANYNPIAFQDVIEKLASYPERRATAYLRYWTTTNRWMPKWDAGYESYMPPEDTPPKVAPKRTYEPRIKIPSEGPL